MLSTGHIILIFLVILLFFGAKRLPEVARAMGKAVNEFKKAKDEVSTSVEADAAAKPAAPAPAAPVAPAAASAAVPAAKPDDTGSKQA